MTAADNPMASSTSTFPHVPVCWPRLSPQLYVERLTELSSWLNWLKARYGLDHRTLPDCWQEHGALIEELSALATAWTTAYSSKTDGYNPLHWHTDFALTRRRLIEWTSRSGCRPDEPRG